MKDNVAFKVLAQAAGGEGAVESIFSVSVGIADRSNRLEFMESKPVY